MFKNLPVVMLCGDGGSGKDEIAVQLSKRWKLTYSHSTSYVAAKLMWPQVEAGLFCPQMRAEKGNSCPYTQLLHFNIKPTAFTGLENWYGMRSAHRRFWAEWIDCYNQGKAQLYLDAVLDGNHILTGLRKVREFHAFQQTGIPDVAIWIERPGIPRDPTQEYGPELCDLVLRNDSDLVRLHTRIERITNFLTGMYWGEH